MATGSVTVRLKLNAAGYSAEMTKAQAQMKQLTTSAREFGHGTVSSMQASSAAIRVLEGGITGNIRAAERFISMLPGVGAALQAAFPIVGAIALGAVFVRIGEEALNFKKKLDEIPQNPFGQLIASEELSNDQLAITNDRLASAIAQLEKRPSNGMALAIDQAREASDKLFDSLQKANQAFGESLQKGNVSGLQGLWRNQTPTAEANRRISIARAGVQQVIADHQQTLGDALSSGDQGNIAQAREALMVDLQKAYAAQDAALRAGLAEAQKKQADFSGSYSVGSDPGIVIQKYQAALQQSASEQQSAGEQYGNTLLTGRLDTDQAAAKQTELAKAAARKLLQQMQDELEQRKAQYGMSLAEERSYWQQRISAFTRGSDAYREVSNKAAQLEIEMERQRAEVLKSYRTQQAQALQQSTRVLQESGAAVSALMKRQAEDALKTGDRWRAYNDELARSAQMEGANKAAIAEAAVSMGVATGQLSRLDAARTMMAIHEEQYQSGLAALQGARVQIGSQDESPEKETALSRNQAQIDELNTHFGIQQQQDRQAIQGDTISGAVKDALNQMVGSFDNMASQIKQIISRTMDGLNDDIVKAMTGEGKRGDFGQTLKQAGHSLLKSSLQGAEGAILGKLSHGKIGPKPDGSSPQTALWVRMAGGPAPGSSSGQGGAQGSSGNSGGSIWSQLLQGVFRKHRQGQGQSDGGGGGGGTGAGDSGGGGGGDIFQGAFGGGGGTGAGDSGGDGGGGDIFQGVFGGGGGMGAGDSGGDGGVGDIFQGAFGGGGGMGAGDIGGDGGGDDIFQGAFARGGHVLAHRAALVGEHGPEMFVPHSAGRIVPHKDLIGGGKYEHHEYHIDARGAIDPSAVFQAVARAIPHAVAASMQAQHQAKMRKPHAD